MKRTTAPRWCLTLVFSLICATGCATGTEGGQTDRSNTDSETSRQALAQKNRDGHDQACDAVGRAPGTECQWDSQCAVCHDGSSCGTVMTTREVDRRGDGCRKPDAAECEYSAPRCCAGRCVRAPH